MPISINEFISLDHHIPNRNWSSIKWSEFVITFENVVHLIYIEIVKFFTGLIGITKYKKIIITINITNNITTNIIHYLLLIYSLAFIMLIYELLSNLRTINLCCVSCSIWKHFASSLLLFLEQQFVTQWNCMSNWFLVRK